MCNNFETEDKAGDGGKPSITADSYQLSDGSGYPS